MTRWLVQFGYDGGPFAGWARQPHRRTVEGEILEGVVRCGVAPSAEAARLAVASRTDRGVSARANALALSSARSGPTLLRALNGIAPEILFRRARPVEETFRVRAPRSREYRYLLADAAGELDRWRPWLPSFLHGPIDVRSFARGVPAERPCWRRIEELELVGAPDGAYLRIRASGFLWGMVRKIVGAMTELAAGRVRPSALEEALRGRRRLTVPLAAPEPLILWEVDFGEEWPFATGRPSRAQSAYLDLERRRALAHTRVLEGIGRSGLPPDML